MQAIIVPYVMYQNAPSRPLSKIYDIPTYPQIEDGCLETLTAVYQEVFGEFEGELNIHDTADGGYGDLTVWAGDDDCFLYVIFVK